jgi:hypothetical protein
LNEPVPSGPILRRTFGRETTGLRVVPAAEERRRASGELPEPATRSTSASTAGSERSDTADSLGVPSFPVRCHRDGWGTP